MATKTNWKRGLLRAWLALSLLWAAGFAIFLAYLLMDLLGEVHSSGILIVAGLLYILPLGALPPLIFLAVGSLIFWIISLSTKRKTSP